MDYSGSVLSGVSASSFDFLGINLAYKPQPEWPLFFYFPFFFYKEIFLKCKYDHVISLFENF